jgi:hypothetical protein
MSQFRSWTMSAAHRGVIVIAGVTLLVAVAGSAYAASARLTAAPRATTPAGIITHWMHVSKKFTILSTSAGGRVLTKSLANPALVTVGWGDQVPAQCVPVASLDNTMGPGSTGGDGGFASTGDAPNGVIVKTFNYQGQNTPQSFYLAVICP